MGENKVSTELLSTLAGTASVVIFKLIDIYKKNQEKAEKEKETADNIELERQKAEFTKTLLEELDKCKEERDYWQKKYSDTIDKNNEK